VDGELSGEGREPRVFQRVLGVRTLGTERYQQTKYGALVSLILWETGKAMPPCVPACLMPEPRWWKERGYEVSFVGT
jgi:hypothetical protein